MKAQKESLLTHRVNYSTLQKPCEILLPIYLSQEELGSEQCHPASMRQGRELSSALSEFVQGKNLQLFLGQNR